MGRTLRALLAHAAMASGYVATSNAALPNPALSTVPPCFVSCPFGDIAFGIVVHDAANSPCANSTVALSFAGCTGTIFCPLQEVGTTINPSARTASRVTDATGSTVFHLRMGGLCPGAQLRVTADQVLLAFRNVASVDQDGNLDVTAVDQAIVGGKVGTADASADFDCNGTVDAADVALQNAHLNHSCDSTTPALPRSWGELKTMYR